MEKRKIRIGNVAYGASLVAQRLKRLPAMQETWVRALGREDPLDKIEKKNGCLDNHKGLRGNQELEQG